MNTVIVISGLVLGNLLVAGLYIFSVIFNNRTIEDLLNRLSSRSYNEYAHIELEKNKLANRGADGSKKKDQLIKL